MHRHDEDAEELTRAVVRYAIDRVRMQSPPLDGPVSPDELRRRAGETITDDGIGGDEALRIFSDVLAPACISIDHPRFLSFVPAAPTEAAVLFDLVVGASSIYGGSWLEGGGAIYAENETLAWIARLAGMPKSTGGVFVSGGTAGNLSALLAARHQWRRLADGRLDRARGLIVASKGAHSSVAQAARAMDADVALCDADERGRLSGAAVRALVDGLDEDDLERLFAIVATAGTTNAGVVDDLAGAADVAVENGVWFHVDGAYGAAALAAPSVREHFVGIERADSLILDPHKWLFAPFDACALLYRDPEAGRAAHTQQAEYLDVLHPVAEPGQEPGPWNASDFAHHLTRRARGLPLWFSLATHGTRAYEEAVETTLRVVREGADVIRGTDHLELIMEPELSILLFRRTGWDAEQYQQWSDRMLAEQIAFVTPTKWGDETVLRLCVVNPLTTVDDISLLVEMLA